MSEAGTYNILVVEDEKIIRDGIAGSLAEVREFRVQTAENGVRGMELLEETAIHGIVLDIKMPRMDGLELLEWIRDKNLGAAIFDETYMNVLEALGENERAYPAVVFWGTVLQGEQEIEQEFEKMLRKHLEK